MATIPRIPKKPEPPKPLPVPTYTIEQMKAFGWLRDMPPDYRGPVPRLPLTLACRTDRILGTTWKGEYD